MSINKVPVEIWEDIVEWCFIADDWDVSRQLSQVNRQIRHNLLSTPFPWRRIYIKAFELHDTDDKSIRESYEAWASEINKRSEHSVKYIHMEMLNSPKNRRHTLIHTSSLDDLLRPFRSQQLEKLIFTCGQPYVELFSLAAKHIIARHTGLDDDSEPIVLYLNDTVETVDCEDAVLRYPDVYTSDATTSLRSARLDFTGRQQAIVRNELYTGDDIRNAVNTLDDEQFEVIFSSPELEALTVIHSDAATWTTSKSMPHLKSLTVSNSHCDFFLNVEMPHLETLTLVDCFDMSSDSNNAAFIPESIKHLAVIRTETSYNFHLPNLISLNLEGSPEEWYYWWDLLWSLNSVSGLSLKALNISFMDLNLEVVLSLVRELNLEQLVCDQPCAKAQEDCESAIRDIVPHYWTSVEQYYKDVHENDDLEQYFFDAPVEPLVPLESDVD